MFDYDVFLSFSSADLGVVKPIWQRLTTSGVRVFWSDDNLKAAAGRNFIKVIEAALVNSRDFVLYWTDNAQRSPWVEEEYQVFFNQCYLRDKTGRRLLLVSAPSARATLPPFLQQLQHVASLDELVDVLGGIDVAHLRSQNAELERRIAKLQADCALLTEKLVRVTRDAAAGSSAPASAGTNESVVMPSHGIEVNPMPSYFRPVRGRLLYDDGTNSTFLGFRCRYSGRMYYARSFDAITSNNYTSSPTIAIEQIDRIDFSEQAKQNVRRANVSLRGGKTLENVYLVVTDCEWWDEPALQGTFNDPTLVAVTFDPIA